jgi:NAD-dependent dihydropyrimidine dehydrogenase PreA subunit
MPKINGSLCIGCGACEYICPADVIRMKGEKAYVAYPEDCISTASCRVCERRCPVQAISWVNYRSLGKKEFSPFFSWEERKQAWGISTTVIKPRQGPAHRRKERQ